MLLLVCSMIKTLLFKAIVHVTIITSEGYTVKQGYNEAPGIGDFTSLKA